MHSDRKGGDVVEATGGISLSAPLREQLNVSQKGVLETMKDLPFVHRISCSLPPRVEGNLCGELHISIPYICIKDSEKKKNSNDSYSVRLKWWGEDGKGTIFLPSSSPALLPSSCTDYPQSSIMEKECSCIFPLKAGMSIFQEYMNDMEFMQLEVIDRYTGNIYGYSKISIQFDESTLCTSSTIYLKSDNRVHIGNITVYGQIRIGHDSFLIRALQASNSVKSENIKDEVDLQQFQNIIPRKALIVENSIKKVAIENQEEYSESDDDISNELVTSFQLNEVLAHTDESDSLPIWPDPDRMYVPPETEGTFVHPGIVALPNKNRISHDSRRNSQHHIGEESSSTKSSSHYNISIHDDDFKNRDQNINDTLIIDQNEEAVPIQEQTEKRHISANNNVGNNNNNMNHKTDNAYNARENDANKSNTNLENNRYIYIKKGENKVSYAESENIRNISNDENITRKYLQEKTQGNYSARINKNILSDITNADTTTNNINNDNIVSALLARGSKLREAMMEATGENALQCFLGSSEEEIDCIFNGLKIFQSENSGKQNLPVFPMDVNSIIEDPILCDSTNHEESGTNLLNDSDDDVVALLRQVKKIEEDPSSLIKFPILAAIEKGKTDALENARFLNIAISRLLWFNQSTNIEMASLSYELPSHLTLPPSMTSTSISMELIKDNEGSTTSGFEVFSPHDSFARDLLLGIEINDEVLEDWAHHNLKFELSACVSRVMSVGKKDRFQTKAVPKNIAETKVIGIATLPLRDLLTSSELHVEANLEILSVCNLSNKSDSSGETENKRLIAKKIKSGKSVNKKKGITQSNLGELAEANLDGEKYQNLKVPCRELLIGNKEDVIGTITVAIALFGGAKSIGMPEKKKNAPRVSITQSNRETTKNYNTDSIMDANSKEGQSLDDMIVPGDTKSSTSNDENEKLRNIATDSFLVSDTLREGKGKSSTQIEAKMSKFRQPISIANGEFEIFFYYGIRKAIHVDPFSILDSSRFLLPAVLQSLRRFEAKESVLKVSTINFKIWSPLSILKDFHSIPLNSMKSEFEIMAAHLNSSKPEQHIFSQSSTYPVTLSDSLLSGLGQKSQVFEVWGIIEEYSLLSHANSEVPLWKSDEILFGIVKIPYSSLSYFLKQSDDFEAQEMPFSFVDGRCGVRNPYSGKIVAEMDMCFVAGLPNQIHIFKGLDSISAIEKNTNTNCNPDMSIKSADDGLSDNNDIAGSMKREIVDLLDLKSTDLVTSFGVNEEVDLPIVTNKLINTEETETIEAKEDHLESSNYSSIKNYDDSITNVDRSIDSIEIKDISNESMKKSDLVRHVLEFSLQGQCTIADGTINDDEGLLGCYVKYYIAGGEYCRTFGNTILPNQDDMLQLSSEGENMLKQQEAICLWWDGDSSVLNSHARHVVMANSDESFIHHLCAKDVMIFEILVSMEEEKIIGLAGRAELSIAKLQSCLYNDNVSDVIFIPVSQTSSSFTLGFSELPLSIVYRKEPRAVSRKRHQRLTDARTEEVESEHYFHSSMDELNVLMHDENAKHEEKILFKRSTVVDRMLPASSILCADIHQINKIIEFPSELREKIDLVIQDMENADCFITYRIFNGQERSEKDAGNCWYSYRTELFSLQSLQSSDILSTMFASEFPVFINSSFVEYLNNNELEIHLMLQKGVIELPLAVAEISLQNLLSSMNGVHGNYSFGFKSEDNSRIAIAEFVFSIYFKHRKQLSSIKANEYIESDSKIQKNERVPESSAATRNIESVNSSEDEMIDKPDDKDDNTNIIESITSNAGDKSKYGPLSDTDGPKISELDSKEKIQQDNNIGDINTIDLNYDGPEIEEKCFKVAINIECAMHLSFSSETIDCFGEDASIFITFQWDKCSEVVFTDIQPKISSPHWNQSFIIDVPLSHSNYNYLRSHVLYFNVWMRPQGIRWDKNVRKTFLEKNTGLRIGDHLLGTASVELTALLTGMREVHGWYHILDTLRDSKGQLLLHIQPLQSVSTLHYESDKKNEKNIRYGQECPLVKYTEETEELSKHSRGLIANYQSDTFFSIDNTLNDTAVESTIKTFNLTSKLNERVTEDITLANSFDSPGEIRKILEGLENMNSRLTLQFESAQDVLCHDIIMSTAGESPQDTDIASSGRNRNEDIINKGKFETEAEEVPVIAPVSSECKNRMTEADNKNNKNTSLTSNNKNDNTEKPILTESGEIGNKVKLTVCPYLLSGPSNNNISKKPDKLRTYTEMSSLGNHHDKAKKVESNTVQNKAIQNNTSTNKKSKNEIKDIPRTNNEKDSHTQNIKHIADTEVGKYTKKLSRDIIIDDVKDSDVNINTDVVASEEEHGMVIVSVPLENFANTKIIKSKGKFNDEVISCNTILEEEENTKNQNPEQVINKCTLDFEERSSQNSNNELNQITKSFDEAPLQILEDILDGVENQYIANKQNMENSIHLNCTTSKQIIPESESKNSERCVTNPSSTIRQKKDKDVSSPMSMPPQISRSYSADPRTTTKVDTRNTDESKDRIETRQYSISGNIRLEAEKPSAPSSSSSSSLSPSVSLSREGVGGHVVCDKNKINKMEAAQRTSIRDFEKNSPVVQIKKPINTLNSPVFCCQNSKKTSHASHSSEERNQQTETLLTSRGRRFVDSETERIARIMMGNLEKVARDEEEH